MHYATNINVSRPSWGTAVFILIILLMMNSPGKLGSRGLEVRVIYERSGCSKSILACNVTNLVYHSFTTFFLDLSKWYNPIEL